MSPFKRQRCLLELEVLEDRYTPTHLGMAKFLRPTMPPPVVLPVHVSPQPIVNVPVVQFNVPAPRTDTPPATTPLPPPPDERLAISMQQVHHGNVHLGARTRFRN